MKRRKQAKLFDAPWARERFERLREVLKRAATAFKDPNHPHCPEELLEIFGLVGELQPAIGKRKKYRVPFWKCVVALDHARPGLALIRTLDRLVTRACNLPPSPLTRLRNLLQDGQLNAHQSGLVHEIAKAFPPKPTPSLISLSRGSLRNRSHYLQGTAKTAAPAESALHLPRQLTWSSVALHCN
jgi:hypothetical protein